MTGDWEVDTPVRSNQRAAARAIRLAPLLAVALLALSGACALAAPAARVRHVLERPVCPRPRPGHPECMAVVIEPVSSGTPGAVAQAVGSVGGEGIGGGLTPAQLAKAYEYNPTESGYGQTIALIDANDDPKIEEDLGVFDKEYKLPECTSANGCFKQVSASGASTESLPKAGTESLETTLDVETARAVCQTCNILLVEGNEGYSYEGVNEAAKLGASEISNSYAEPESKGDESSVTSYFTHPGVVITAAAGDEGYDFWDAFNNKKVTKVAEKPGFPASSPTVISVGGTTLSLNKEGKREHEPVWNGDGPDNEKKGSGHIVSGGGCSTVFAAQPWQQNTPGWSATGCGGKRLDNDVAADSGFGLSIYDNYNCGKACEEQHFGTSEHEWIAVGGTSLSSPIVAAMFGLAGGSGGVSYPAATLYSHLGESSAFFNVIEGGNGYCDDAPESICGKPNSEHGELLDCEGTLACDAATGFNGPSGVGVPKGLYGLRADDFTAVTQTSATLQSRVNPDGSNVTACEFEYGTTTGYGTKASCKALPGSGEKPVLVSAAVTGLLPNTEYHFRVLTTNGKGTLRGPDIVFRTLSPTAPSVETKGSAGVGEKSATVYASVNPRGGSVSTCKFEYGTTTSYGSSVSCASLPGSGSSPVVVDASIASGLAANTTYHYRISATNSSGTSKGGDVTFKTS
jgi:hypothetical protein